MHIGQHRPRWLKVVAVVLSILLIFVLSLGTAWFFGSRSYPLTTTLDEAHITLSYDQKLRKTKLTSEDAQQNFALRLVEPAGSLPVQVSVRYEAGLQAAAALTKQNIRDMLLSNIDKAYPNRFANYNKISQQQFSLDSHDAAEVIFTYTSPSSEQIKQRFWLVTVSADQVAYISAQAKESDFDSLNNQFFEPIFKSVKVDL